jgi:hypothetical protein
MWGSKKRGGGGGSRFLQNTVSYVLMTLHHNKLLFNETNRCTSFQIYSCTKLYMSWVEELSETCRINKFGNKCICWFHWKVTVSYLPYYMVSHPSHCHGKNKSHTFQKLVLTLKKCEIWEVLTGVMMDI